MTKDDVIRMAKASGLLYLEKSTRFGPPDDVLERFAALVAAHEREECAKLCDLESVKWKSPKYNFATASAEHCALAIRARCNQ